MHACANTKNYTIDEETAQHSGLLGDSASRLGFGRREGYPLRVARLDF
jgi:hypothetical protein